MSSMNECFSKRLEELIDEFPEHNLIFFKGVWNRTDAAVGNTC